MDKSLMKEEFRTILEIEKRLNATTFGNWVATGIPYDELDDPCILTENGIYIAQTTYDTLSNSEEHKVNEDTIFIANAKSDIQFLLNFIKNSRGVL